MKSATMGDFLEALGREPGLCSWGIGDPIMCKQNNIDFERSRESLKTELEMFQGCCAWLALCSKGETINPKAGNSYGLKHRVENWFGQYVTNGAFIAALIHMGFKYERRDDSPNVHVAVSTPLPQGSFSQRHLMTENRKVLAESEYR
jgi:hypothetical protein